MVLHSGSSLVVRVIGSRRAILRVVFIGFGFSAHGLVHLLGYPSRVFLQTGIFIENVDLFCVLNGNYCLMHKIGANVKPYSKS